MKYLRLFLCCFGRHQVMRNYPNCVRCGALMIYDRIDKTWRAA